MKYLIMIYSALLWLCSTQAQEIPNNRLVDWSKVGYTTPAEIPGSQYDFKVFKSNFSGNTSDSEIMNTILEEIGDEGTFIYFSNGDYYFDESINLKSNVYLIGESSDSTILSFDLNGSNHLINISGNAPNTINYCENTISKGDTHLNMLDASGYTTGDIIKLVSYDDDLITSSWAAQSTGQVNIVTAVQGNVVYLGRPIRREHTLNNAPGVIIINAIENVSIESLKLKRLDETETQTSNINIENAFNINVSCVSSLNSNFAHIAISNSGNVGVIGSFFKDGFDYGGGGKAYGIVLQFASSDCLIENNIFNHLRHSMLLQAGANGNVLANNYSNDPYWNEGFLPTNSAGDLVLHGNYPYANLMEGNMVQNIVIDDSHGMNGPYNTFLRNRADKYGIIMSSASDSQNFIGNEITQTGFLLGNYMLSGNDHYEYGNNIKGNTVPSATDDLTVNTLYAEGAPEYYTENNVWPTIGYPNSLSENNNVAYDLSNEGNETECESTIEDSTGGATAIREINESLVLQFFPNPVDDVLHLSLQNINEREIKKLQVFSAAGKYVYNGEFTNQLDTKHLSSGMYFIRLITIKDETITHKLMKK